MCAAYVDVYVFVYAQPIHIHGRSIVYTLGICIEGILTFKRRDEIIPLVEVFAGRQAGKQLGR